MITLVIIGIICIVLGFLAVIKGKIPFIKKYNSVKKIALHSRIEGSAVLLVGVLFIFQYFTPMNSAALIITLLFIAILALVLEIVLKAI